MLSRRLLRIKVAQAVYSHIQSGEQNIARTRNELIHSAHKCYQLYILFLRLPVEIKKYAAHKIDIGKAKLRPSPIDINPNTRFIHNPVIEILENSQNLNKALDKLSWGDDKLMLKAIYNDMINDDSYKKYMDKEIVTFDDHKIIIKNILKKHIEDNNLLETLIEDMSIFWLDDIGYTLAIAIQTIGAIKKTDPDIDIPKPFKADDEEFAILLLEKTILQWNDALKTIDDITKNWEIERIALMDKILMATAIAEITNCHSIPVKASLDEFIEIAKFYSTPQSSTFINGVLDKAVESLQNQGKIKKSGRGLL